MSLVCVGSPGHGGSLLFLHPPSSPDVFTKNITTYSIVCIARIPLVPEQNSEWHIRFL